MSLVVVERYYDLPRAQIAASLLRSAGIEAVVFDAEYGSVDWAAQSALGGFRLAAPASDLDDARALLTAPPTAPEEPGVDPDPAPPPTGSYLRTAFALLASFLIAFEAGWIIAGLRRRVGPGPADYAFGVTLSVILLAVALGTIPLLIWIVIQLIVDPP